jgi:hypothetical protein
VVGVGRDAMEVFNHAGVHLFTGSLPKWAGP